MGLKNYNEQISLIRQADSQIAYLNTYANSMNALIISLGSLWDDNVDQSYMLNAIGNCVHMASEIAYDYSVFSANSIKWLNNMDNLEKLVRALIPGKDLKVKPFRSDYDTSPGTQKDRIRVNPDDLSDFATQVDGYTKRLEAIHVKTSGLNKQIDNLIISKFASNYSLNGINRRIVKLKNINSNIATALRKIADAYRKTENELKGMVNALELGADSTGNLNPQVEKATVEEQQKSDIDVAVQTVSGAVAVNATEKTEIRVTVVAEKQDNNTASIVDTQEDSVTLKESVVEKGVLDDPELYPKQGKSNCTMYANLYLMRRYAKMNGDPNWKNINEHSRSDLWINGKGMVNDYTFKNGNDTLHVGSYRNDKYRNQILSKMDGAQKRTFLQELLQDHPEGIVIYDRETAKTESKMHAVLLTDYKDGKFYMADPASGQYNIEEGALTTLKLESIDTIWIVDKKNGTKF